MITATKQRLMRWRSVCV